LLRNAFQRGSSWRLRKASSSGSQLLRARGARRRGPTHEGLILLVTNRIASGDHECGGIPVPVLGSASNSSASLRRPSSQSTCDEKRRRDASSVSYPFPAMLHSACVDIEAPARARHARMRHEDSDPGTRGRQLPLPLTDWRESVLATSHPRVGSSRLRSTSSRFKRIASSR